VASVSDGLTFHKFVAAGKIAPSQVLEGSWFSKEAHIMDGGRRMIRKWLIQVGALAGVWGAMSADGKDVATTKVKRTIGATATIVESSSGIAFPARVDTGAETCSLHVEKIDIQDKKSTRQRNIGKTIRFLLKASDGKTHWAEGIVADAVRVKSSSLKSGDFDHRYKVRLTLQWKDVRKEVLVTLNDRTAMEYPLLIGRNFLERDFLVDVDLDKDQSPTKSGGQL
jgi:hypothetical protein